MHILVTGGAGFIGSNLVKRLLREGHVVTVVDDFSTGRWENLADVAGSTALKIIEACCTTAMPYARFEFDQIYHLACPASPPKYQFNPVHTIKTCVLGAIAALEYCKPRKTRILLASTSEVYGDPQQHPQVENYYGNVNPIGPRACYDEGKRISETLFMDYHRFHGVDTRIVRIFNTYGPGMDPHDGRVITNFIRQATAGEPLTIYGDGTQTRSFCYIDDTIEGMMRVMNYTGLEQNTPFNIGNQDEYSINQLASTIENILCDNPGPRTRMPMPINDPKRRRPDTWKAKMMLDWQPTTTLHTGLHQMIESMNAETLSEK